MQKTVVIMVSSLVFILLISSIGIKPHPALDNPGPTPSPPQEERRLEILDIYIYMEDEDLDELYSRSVLSDERLPGTARLGLDGSLLELEGIRFRGNTARRKPKKSFSIKFIERQDFVFRIWSINVKEASFTGDLTLYYRNNYLGDLGKENWYHKRQSTGGQWDLVMSRVDGGQITTLPSRVNPYSNKVMATITTNSPIKLILNEK